MKLLEKFPDIFLAEIAAQPAALRRAAAAVREQLPMLERIPEVSDERSLVFTGMGGSYGVCYAPVTTLAGLGIPALMVDAAELLYFRRDTLGRRTILVVVSQSGESVEVVRLVEGFSGEPTRPFIVSVTNGLDNALARAADVSLDTRAGEERGPSTLTFAASLVVSAAVVQALAGRPLGAFADSFEAEAAGAADAVDGLLVGVQDRARRLRQWLGNRTILALLARGAARAASEMGALTLKEAARFPAESIESAQFRHGPLELAGPQTAVVVIATEESTRELDVRLSAELLKAGAAVLLITCDPHRLEGAETVAIGHHDRLLSPAPAIVPLQLLAWRLAVERGYRPGTYTIATKVTTRE